MRKILFDTWTIFGVLVFGLLLLMISARPELQPRRGHEDAPGDQIAVVGSVLSLASGSLLGFRMVRSSRELARTNKPGPGA